MEWRFLKLECRQTYQELETNRSQEAYSRGDVAQAEELLLNEAEADRPLYDDIKSRGIEYARLRLVEEPLTPYLNYELLAYRIRAKMGEVIEIVRCDAVRGLTGDDYFDFLLFDRHTALIHDYGDTGLQSGGWVTEDPAVLASLERTATGLRRVALTLGQFLAAK